MNQGCLSDLALEAHLLELPRRSADAHVSGCLECQGRLDRMRTEGVTFRRQVFPQTIDAVLAGRSAGSGFWRRWLLPLGVAIPAAAAILLAVHPQGRSADAPSQEQGFQAKGVAHPVDAVPLRLDFHAFAGGPEGVQQLTEGASVAAAAKLRFSVSAPEHCWLSVVSVDGTGAVSQLYPAEPTGIEVPRASLPGGAVLEGGAGPERLFALCSPRPTPVASLTEEARNSLPKNAESIRALRRLPGLPGDVIQETVLVEKAPGKDP